MLQSRVNEIVKIHGGKTLDCCGIYYLLDLNKVQDSFSHAPLKERQRQGHSKAQYQLAINLKFGIGCDIDLLEADLWFKKATIQQHPEIVPLAF